MLDDPAHGGGGSIGIGGGGSGPDDGAAAPDPARRLPSDLPTSLDDRRLPAEPVSETEMTVAVPHLGPPRKAPHV
jgi:hypothetical protein